MWAECYQRTQIQLRPVGCITDDYELCQNEIAAPTTHVNGVDLHWVWVLMCTRLQFVQIMTLTQCKITRN